MSSIPPREEALFADALAQPEADLGAFLAKECGTDATLLARSDPRKITFRSWIVTFCAVILLGTVACSSAPRVVSRPSAAIAISTTNGQPPNSGELVSIYKAMQPEIEQCGYVLAPNPMAADYIVQIRFASDPTDAAGGRITILGVVPNQPMSVAAAARQFEINSERTISEMTRDQKRAPARSPRR